jgi:hypothetical protein
MQRVVRLPFIKTCVALLTAILWLSAFALPALAQENAPSRDDIVVLTGSVSVGEDETVGDVVIFDGPVRVDGTVNGNLVAFNGRVTVAGTVQGDVLSFNGRVVAQAGAQIDGDVESRPEAQIDPDAQVGGDVGSVNFTRFDDAIAATRVAMWIAFTVSALVLGLLFVLLFPGAADRVELAGESRTGAAIGWGLLLFFGLPILSILLLVTIVGIPLGVALLLSIVPLFALAYIAAGYFLGRRFIKAPRSRLLAVVAGVAVLRVLALIPFLGGLTWFLATVFGLGLLAVAARTRPTVEPTPQRAAVAA